MLIDTHCHIHDSAFYQTGRDEVFARAQNAGVVQMIVVGTDTKSSHQAMEFARMHPGAHAAIGIHPHDAQEDVQTIAELAQTRRESLVAIGEIGLDYFYDNSPRDVQIGALEAQLQIAQDAHLPVIFHVRDAFVDFWPIFDNFKHLMGVLHSFTDTQAELDRGFERGLYVGVNGISTFTRDAAQQVMYRSMPLDRMMLETDAPFLAPRPHRGKTNEPAYLREVAQFHADARRMSFEEVAERTTTNAKQLFGI